MHILLVFAPAEQLTSGSCGCVGEKKENNHHKYTGETSVVWQVLCTDPSRMYKTRHTRLFEPKVLMKILHIVDTLYEVFISTCKMRLQQFTLHKQTCNLNQKMQRILIQNIKVNYKNNLTCPPLAFIALHFIEIFP